MLFWKEHKNDTECMHCDSSRYVMVINEDGAYVTIEMVVKQLCYIPITPCASGGHPQSSKPSQSRTG
jgi:hypothetical protein